MSGPNARHWWQDAVVYQVYLRSFADADGDGVGDLDGIRGHLDDLAGLGVDALWLNPCYPSPQRDHGYDVADYFGIHHEYGTLETFDHLVREAHARDLRIVMDLVPNHCSSEHEWFGEARAAAPGSPARDRFWIRDGRPDGHGDPHGAPPNNWRAGFGGSAWTRMSPTDPQWYMGTFTPHQPDLDHNNADVRAMFVEALGFWFDRGVDGFRVDAVQPVGKHPDLPDQPPAPPGTHEMQLTWENPYLIFRPEGHDVWRYMRRAVDDYMEAHPGRVLVLVAEAYLVGQRDMVLEFARPDEFHQVFTFELMLANWNVGGLRAALDDVFWLIDHGVDPCWTLNNHDIQRIVTRLGRADVHLPATVVAVPHLASDAPTDLAVGRRRARALISLAMALPGSLYLYQGEELGLPEVYDIPDDRREDPLFIATGGAQLGRDGCRVPLPWTADPRTSYGFSAVPAGRDRPDPPWLPQPSGWGMYARDAQQADEGSDLALYRALLAARRELAVGAAEVVDLGRQLVAVRRGDLVVAVNVTRDPAPLDPDHPALAGPAGPLRPLLASEPTEMQTPGVVPPDSTVWLGPARADSD